MIAAGKEPMMEETEYLEWEVMPIVDPGWKAIATRVPADKAHVDEQGALHLYRDGWEVALFAPGKWFGCVTYMQPREHFNPTTVQKAVAK